MSYSKLITVSAAIVPLCFAGPVQAASEADAVWACASALSRKVEESSEQRVRMSIDETSDQSSARLRTAATFHLDAFKPGSDDVIVRARCLVNTKGRVVNLTMLPLSAPDARERSRG